MSFKPPLCAVLRNRSQRGQSLLPTIRGLGGFVERRIFNAKIIIVPGKSGQLVTLHVTEHGPGHSQSEDFSCDLPPDARAWGLLDFHGFSAGTAVVCRPAHPQHMPLLELPPYSPLRQPWFGALFLGWSFRTLLKIFSFSLESFCGVNNWELRDVDKKSYLIV